MSGNAKVADRHLRIMASLFAVFILSGSAVGMASNLNDDVQCIVVGARLANSADPNQKLAGEMLLIYFLGRIDGRWPDADLEKLVGMEATKDNLLETGPIAKKCGAQFSARGAYLDLIGKSLSRAAK